MFDQEFVFTSAELKATLRLHDVKRQTLRADPHITLGVGDRYHAFLRCQFKKVTADAPNISDESSLTLAVKAENVLSGP